MCVNESHSYKPYEENREQEIAVCNYLNSRMTHKGSLLGFCVIPSINRYFMSFMCPSTWGAMVFIRWMSLCYTSQANDTLEL